MECSPSGKSAVVILFDLRCQRDHAFEAWFRDNASFEAQAKDGRVECPACGSRKVEKAIMAPRISKGRGSEAAGQVASQAATGPGPAAPEGEGKTVVMSSPAEDAKALRAALEQLRDHVEANCDDVGPAFPEEARKIHYGEAEARGIYGEATDSEAAELAEEGVPFSRLPLPRRRDS